MQPRVQEAGCGTFNAAYTSLYSVDQGSGAFYAVDPATGAATFVGNTGISTPLDLSTDAGGTVYVADLNGGIHTVNTGTGAATFVKNVGFGLTAIDFDPSGSLYGVSLNNDILYRDLLGTPVAVGPLSPNYSDVRGLEFAASRTEVPEPTTLALLGMGLLGLAAARRNRRAA